MDPLKILVLCTGNTCRSPLAEVILRHTLEEAGLTDVKVTSAGTSAWGGEPVSEGSYLVALEHSLDLTGHRARRLTPSLINDQDLILTMTRSHLRMARELGGEGKTFVFGEYAGIKGDAAEVKDPVGGPMEAYRETYKELEAMSKKVAERLQRERARGQR